jgi:serine phosphatase RsbU (regulator of sigma subunit)/anti-sigma regulatory factor (Ser/Thr protein kinase)
VEGPRVLVVDDNADMREYVAGLLAEDYVVERAVDGLDALERIGRARPDLVLTDVMMPNMDGFGLLERLRADPMTVEIPVVMVSARAGEDGVVEGLDAGADDYLVKPFSARELRARVRVNLELHRVRQAVRQEVEERERAIADQLQRSLLPAASFELEHLELATYYAPGVVGTQVGGDWYDVIEISPVRTALVIGDVMGRGVAAASVMGQLRSAVRALARLDIPPGELVGELDGIVQELGRSQIVTCFYAVFDAHQRVLTYASAGHMPLFVVGADGVIHRSTAAGPPLGAGSTGQTTQQHELAEGDTVVLYTDGLVERRDQDVMAGLHALERELATAAYEPASELPRLLAGRLMPEGPEDDVAVLVARVRGEAYRASRWHYLALTPRLAAEARGQVDAQLGEWGLPAAFRADVALVVSELVTNAYRHGGPPIEHRVVHTGRSVVVEVADGSPIRPTPRSVTPREEAGRGLAIIARLADRWGSRAAGTGKVVWASLRPERQEDSR